MKSIHGTGLRAMTALPLLLLVGACATLDEPAETLGDQPELQAESAPGGPVTPPTTPTPGGTVTMCAANRLWFNGACRTVNYLARFVTPGAVFVMVEGKRFDDGREAIVIVEAPNARTTRMKIISQEHTNIGALARKFLFGHEVLSEYTVTQFLGEDGFHETVSTLDAVRDGSFETVWYERVARGRSRKYTWSSDLCEDVYGNPVGYEDGEACGPELAIASGDDSVDWCEEVGELTQSGSKLGCLFGAAYVSLQVAGAAGAAAVLGSGSTSLVLAAGSVVSNPGATAGLTIAGAVAVGEAVDAADTACTAVSDFAEDVGRIVCELVQTSVGDTPDPVAIELEDPSASIIGEDPCAAVGGETYEGGPGVVYSGDCAGSESDGIDRDVNLTLSAAAAYEITVYGDRDECTPVTVSATDGLCVVVSH